MGAVIIVEYPLYAKYMIIINDKIKPNMLNIAVPFYNILPLYKNNKHLIVYKYT